MAINEMQNFAPLEVFHHNSKKKFNVKRADMFDVIFQKLVLRVSSGFPNTRK